jgi:hypothetical protein
MGYTIRGTIQQAARHVGPLCSDLNRYTKKHRLPVFRRGGLPQPDNPPHLVFIPALVLLVGPGLASPERGSCRCSGFTVMAHPLAGATAVRILRPPCLPHERRRLPISGPYNYAARNTPNESALRHPGFIAPRPPLTDPAR